MSSSAARVPGSTGGLAADLLAAMPALRGSIAAHVPLAPMTWFRTGGTAEALFEPDDETDLAYFLQRCDPAIPVFTMGLGSNLLVRDGGIDGVVLRLGKGFAALGIEDGTIVAGAAVPDVKLASAAVRAGVAGLAFLRGIPGSIGGALRMNGGAYGRETADAIESARGVDRSGAIRTFSRDAMGFTYRHCDVAADIVFTQARFAGQAGDPEQIRAEMAAITAARAATQPVNARTGGSTFKNPPGEKAWALIDRAGCRGLVHGDAQVSELHTNFLVNRGRATGADLEGLGEIVRRRVMETSGIALAWEIARVGKPAR